MWDRILKFLRPPVFEDEEKNNAARLIHNLLLIIIVIAALFPVLIYLAGGELSGNTGYLVMILIVASMGLGILLRFGYIQATAIILGFVWWVLFTVGISTFGGLHDTAITGFFFLIILISLVGGWRVLLAFSGLAIASLIGVYIAEHQGIIIPDLNVPSDIADLIMPVVLIAASTFILRMAIDFLTDAYSQAQHNAEKLEQTNLDLQNSQEDLRNRTLELERRARYLEATSTVARDIISELDPETLLRRVAILITDQFEFYHTGLFLLEPGGEFAVLKAASSRGGRRMLERGHRLRVGQEGIVGFVASQGRSRIALDTGTDAVFFDNPDLPDTRSEAAMPLRARGQVIGVLDVQSTEAEAFDNNDIAVLQTLADQIAIALQTAQLFQQVDESLASQRLAYGELSREAWERLTKEQQAVGYHYIKGDIISIDEIPTSTESKLPEISLPLEIDGQVVGYITAHKEETQTDWSSDEISIMQTLSNQLGVALESARLYQETQQRAAREQLTGEVTTRIRESLDIETILKTASEEIRRALNLPEVVIRLGEPTPSQSKGGTE